VSKRGLSFYSHLVASNMPELKTPHGMHTIKGWYDYQKNKSTKKKKEGEK